MELIHRDGTDSLLIKYKLLSFFCGSGAFAQSIPLEYHLLP